MTNRKHPSLTPCDEISPRQPGADREWVLNYVQLHCSEHQPWGTHEVLYRTQLLMLGYHVCIHVDGGAYFTLFLVNSFVCHT